MAETTANKVADFFIRFSHEHGDLITNLKLQKLIYYAQAWYLALYDEPLFDDRLEAWISGPVQPEVYERFKRYRWEPIRYNPEPVEFPEEIEEHLIEVLQVFGKYPAYYLERMVHNELPWSKARRGIPIDEHSTAEISTKDMQTFYKTLIEDEQEEEEEKQEAGRVGTA